MRVDASKTWFVVVLVFFAGIAMTSRAQMTKPAPPTPIDEKKVELGGTPWNPQWDEIIEKALPPEMLSSQVPRGVRRFCPRFYEMGETDKRAFWAYFLQALAGAEATLNPNASVRHDEPEVPERDQVTGITIRSEGLLQLAYADQKRYGCNFNWQVDRTLKARACSRRPLGEVSKFLAPSPRPTWSFVRYPLPSFDRRCSARRLYQPHHPAPSSA